MSTNTLTITNDNFEAEVLNSDKPVLVDFWAEWCGPCQMVSPIIDELADDYVGKAKVCKINVDEQADLTMKYQVMSIPTVMIFKNGEVVDKVVGARSKADFSDMLSKHL